MMKRFVSALAGIALVVSMAGPAGATTKELTAQAGERMRTLGLVKGVDASGTDLALNANITRAQLITILVRAFGKGDVAAQMNGAAAFPDTASHWASGNIAMAKRIIEERTNGKQAIGLPDGTFNPNGNVTAAEAVAFIMKFLGVPTDSGKSWPYNYLAGAQQAGLITANDYAVLDGVKSAPATRGLVFYLADRAFYHYQLPEGKTVYTQFVDSRIPTVTLGSLENEVEAESVTIVGEVSEAGALVADGHVVPLDDKLQFAYTLALAEGPNTVTFTAIDIAGNTSLPNTATITRKVTGSVAEPEVPQYGIVATLGSGRVPVNHEATLNVTFTAGGKPLEPTPAYAVTVDPSLGTYDPATRIFRASRSPGTGSLVVQTGDGLKAEVPVTVFNEMRIRISPDGWFVHPGQMIGMSVGAMDYLGNVGEVGPVEWTLPPGARMDADGFLTIPDVKGPLTIQATAGGKAGTATLWVGVGEVQIEANVPRQLRAGESVHIPITVTQDGQTVKLPVYVAFEKGAWDEESQTLTAGAAPGKATFLIYVGGMSREYEVEVVGK